MSESQATAIQVTTKNLGHNEPNQKLFRIGLVGCHGCKGTSEMVIPTDSESVKTRENVKC